VLTLLGLDPTPEQRLIAAADHCLAAAYRRECPGVDPDALMHWRAASRAAFQRRNLADVLADVEQARKAIRTAPEVVLLPSTGQHCGNLRSNCGCGEKSYGSGDPGASTSYGTGDCYCRCEDCSPVTARDLRAHGQLRELPEASAREGICFIAEGLPLPDGRRKVVCQSGSPDQIRAFMETWAPAQGLVDIYGDPARGFAGGYLPA
jgi:hypothetical protein